MTQIPCNACGAPIEVGQHGSPRTIRTCARCGAGITVPPPTRDVSGDGLFADRYAGQRLRLRPQWFKEARQRLGWVSLFVQQCTLLDVGCATGEFVAAAAEQGFSAYGVDTSHWAADQARELGVHATTGTLSDWKRAHRGVDVDAITLFHVLEHVHEPARLLESARRALKPRGLLFIEVPNFAAAEARRAPADWVGASLEDHVVHYTPDALETLLDSVGFRTLQAEEFSYRRYDDRRSWLRRRWSWLRSGLPRGSRDLLRIVAQNRPVMSP